ncbi:hypothetical protein D3C87_1207880 [compost metagenome]
MPHVAGRPCCRLCVELRITRLDVELAQSARVSHAGDSPQTPSPARVFDRDAIAWREEGVLTRHLATTSVLRPPAIEQDCLGDSLGVIRRRCQRQLHDHVLIRLRDLTALLLAGGLIVMRWVEVGDRNTSREVNFLRSIERHRIGGLCARLGLPEFIVGNRSDGRDVLVLLELDCPVFVDHVGSEGRQQRIDVRSSARRVLQLVAMHDISAGHFTQVVSALSCALAQILDDLRNVDIPNHNPLIGNHEQSVIIGGRSSRHAHHRCTSNANRD